MKRWSYIASAAAMVAIAGFAWAAPTVKEIMGKLHKGQNSPLASLRTELSADAPKWDDIQKKTQEFATLGAALAQNDPPRGAKDSWQKLAKQYETDAVALNEAAKKKDKATAMAARDRLQRSCKSCHDAHRGQ